MKKSLQGIYKYWLNWEINAKLISALLSVTLCSIATLVTTYYIINASNESTRVGTQWTTLGEQVLLRSSQDVNREVTKLETLASTSSIIVAVKSANYERTNWTSEFIAEQDKAWVDKDPSIETIVNDIATNSTSRGLIDFRKTNPDEAEVFVTDIKGLNLAMTDRTSDFLQADEAWWKATFNGGKGASYFGAVEYDESSRVYAMDIGVPIRDLDTHQVVGVMRGTLNVSAMVDYLKNVNVGNKGDIILLDSKGIVLSSHVPAYLMKPVPGALLNLFQLGHRGWRKTVDLEGNPAIVSYISLDNDLGKSLGWRVLVTQNWSEVNKSVKQSLLISILMAIFVTVIGIFFSGRILHNSIVAPLEVLTKDARELSVGNVVRDNSLLKDQLSIRKDEIGEISRAFERLSVYFLNATDASTAIANKNLSSTVIPNSEHDELGNAFAKMVLELNRVIGQVAESAETVSKSASQLESTSDQAGLSTNQIVTTMQQVALGITHQSQDLSKTSCSVEQMGRAIEGVAQGAQKQATAITKASQVTTSITAAIEQVASNAQAGVQGAAHAADVARRGAETVQETIQGMQAIKNKVGLVVQKVSEMGQRSDQIDTIVETIDDIAAQTNLLALNAAIEAARVESKEEKTIESLLQQHMIGVVNLIVDMLGSGRELDSKDLVTLARLAGVPDLSISDGDGVIVASNQPGSLGFRFSENHRLESSVFRPLLNQRDGIVIRPIVVRDEDNQPYIYVGGSRRDCPGIIQAGTSAEIVYALGGYSRGFAVVANEVGKLSEHAKKSTKEIAVLIRSLQKTVKEAVVVMENGAHDVEIGSVQAMQAGESLTAILEVAETVNQQVGEIAVAVGHMRNASTELVSVMQAVSAVVEQNTSVTKEMVLSSTELTRSVENIASVSEQNSAAVEEVSASTEEVLAQVVQVSAASASLMEMAQDLHRIVAQFSLAKTE